MSVVTLASLKAQLNLDHADDDTLLQGKLDAAEAWSGNLIGKPLADFDPLPADIVEAVLQLAAHWYENREAVIVDLSANMLPFGVVALLSPHMEVVM